MNAERRKQERLEPREVTFAALRPRFSKLGKIVDVSKNGLSFQYVTPQRGQTKKTASLEIDIFMGDESYYLQGIPSKLIYDLETNERVDSPGGVEHGRCGLQFRRLTKDQISRWEFFLNNHTKQ